MRAAHAVGMMATGLGAELPVGPVLAGEAAEDAPARNVPGGHSGDADDPSAALAHPGGELGILVHGPLLVPTAEGVERRPPPDAGEARVYLDLLVEGIAEPRQRRRAWSLTPLGLGFATKPGEACEHRSANGGFPVRSRLRRRTAVR